MRRTLLALLATCSLAAHANDNWKPFPLDQQAYDYSGEKLRQAWPQLTRGFGPNYPFPDADYIVTMATKYPKALELTVAGGNGNSGGNGRFWPAPASGASNISYGEFVDFNLNLNAHRQATRPQIVPTGRAPMYVMLDVLFALLADAVAG